MHQWSKAINTQFSLAMHDANLFKVNVIKVFKGSNRAVKVFISVLTEMHMDGYHASAYSANALMHPSTLNLENQQTQSSNVALTIWISSHLCILISKRCLWLHKKHQACLQVSNKLLQHFFSCLLSTIIWLNICMF